MQQGLFGYAQANAPLTAHLVTAQANAQAPCRNTGNGGRRAQTLSAGASASGESPILTDDSSYRTVVELSATLFHHWFREAGGDHRGVQAAGIRAVEDG